MSEFLPSLAEVDAALRPLELATPPSELHGALTGWLAGGGADTPAWLAQVMVDADLPAVSADAPLGRLFRATAHQLEDRGFGLELLLADDDAPLSVRSGSLFDWCRGFLGGFGLAAGAQPPLSEEGAEALADLSRLASAVPQEDGDAEDEDALAEIEEFVRVAVLLLHGDCVMAVRHRQRLH